MGSNIINGVAHRRFDASLVPLPLAAAKVFFRSGWGRAFALFSTVCGMTRAPGPAVPRAGVGQFCNLPSVRTNGFAHCSLPAARGPVLGAVGRLDQTALIREYLAADFPVVFAGHGPLDSFLDGEDRRSVVLKSPGEMGLHPGLPPMMLVKGQNRPCADSSPAGDIEDEDRVVSAPPDSTPAIPESRGESVKSGQVSREAGG